MTFLILPILSLMCLFWIMYQGKGAPVSGIPWKSRGLGGGGDVETKTYYSYQLSVPHQSISPDYPILCYDAYGVLVYTIEPHSPNVNYGLGLYTVPGDQQNVVIESIATATYYVAYATDNVQIDYENAAFYINEALITKPTSVTVWATFQYYAIFTAANDTGKILDGDWNTQMQTVFYAEPPAGYEYAILDLGTQRDIQAIDLIGGFFRPTSDVKFDVKYNATLKYSLDNVNYYDIGTDLINFSMDSGSSKTFEEDKLGFGFSARYIKIILENVERINYGKSSILVTSSNYQQLVDAGVIQEDENNHAEVGDIIILREGLYAVALTEASAYSDIVIKAEATLIPMTVGLDYADGTADEIRVKDTVTDIVYALVIDSGATLGLEESSNPIYTTPVLYDDVLGLHYEMQIQDGQIVLVETVAAVTPSIIIDSLGTSWKLVVEDGVTRIYEYGNAIEVLSTAGFPSSGTAYINFDPTNYFTYTNKTATSFSGIELVSGGSFFTDDKITAAIETDTTLYDWKGLLPKLGDRMFKKDQSKTEYLYTRSDLNYLSKEYLKEFCKNHGKIQVEAMFAPYIKLGQTLEVTDAYNGLNAVRYFVESITYKPNSVSVTLARYPGD